MQQYSLEDISRKTVTRNAKDQRKSWFVAGNMSQWISVVARMLMFSVNHVRHSYMSVSQLF